MKNGIAALALLAGCSDYGIQPPKTITDATTVRGDIDIVVYADTSDSMQDQIDALSENFIRVISRLEQAKSDWHLIVVTGPDGVANEGILSAESADWEASFTTAINTKPEDDLVDEWGLYNVQQALEESLPGGVNAGFLREDAYLHIVFVSDEPDSSPVPDGVAEETYWQAYVDDYLALKRDPNMVKLSAVGGPAPIGCAYTDFSAGYYEAVMATGGDFLSICEDWPAQLEALADTSVTQLSFNLSQEPITDSLKVFVDGLERSGGWSYNEARNSVDFQENPPYAGQKVELRYSYNG